jgi:hemolysin activation/secretion protein
MLLHLRILAVLAALAGLADGAKAEPLQLRPAIGAPSATRIDAVRFTGAGGVPDKALQDTVAPWLHRDLTFDQMRKMAEAVTALYRRRGFMVASAYLPAQTVKDRTVTIAVGGGAFGELRVRENRTLVSDSQILRTLAYNLCRQRIDCKGAGPIRSRQVERAGLLVSEIPGVSAKYELAPGAEPGSTSVILDAKPSKRFQATVGFDNTGFAYTGRNRGAVDLTATNLLGHGDLASLSATYTGKGFFSFAFDGSLPVGYGGARAGATASILRYTLGRQFAVLGATGVSDTAGVYASYPLVRTLNSAVDLRLDLQGKAIRSDVATLGLHSREEAGEATVTLSGSQLDHLLRSGSSQYRFAVTTGQLKLRDAASRTFDDATARTDGGFAKIAYVARREELILPGWTAFAQVSGQYATTNLDSSEKFALGGPQAVRAYDSGAAAADIATVITLETRIRAPASLTGRWQIVAAPFYDYAWATFNRRTWAGYSGPNHAQMAGGGIYVSLADPGRYSLRATYAVRQHTGHDAVPGASDQVWVEAAAAF